MRELENRRKRNKNSTNDMTHLTCSKLQQKVDYCAPVARRSDVKRGAALIISAAQSHMLLDGCRCSSEN